MGMARVRRVQATARMGIGAIEIPRPASRRAPCRRAGFDYAQANFPLRAEPVPVGPKPLAVWAGNEALAMGGAAAGVKFYSAYPMSPSTGVLHWMAANARDLGILVRQGEDELAVINMTIGSAAPFS